MADEHAVPEVPTVEVMVAGELDFRALVRLADTIDQALELRPAELIVDLDRCPRADAAAIDFLLQVHRRTRLAGGQLTLRSPSPRLRRDLQLARVDGVLNVVAAQTPAGAAAPEAAR